MWDLFLQMEMPLTYSLYYMEREGIRVDRQSLKNFSDQLLSMTQDLEKQIYKLVEYDPVNESWQMNFHL